MITAQSLSCTPYTQRCTIIFSQTQTVTEFAGSYKRAVATPEHDSHPELGAEPHKGFETIITIAES